MIHVLNNLTSDYDLQLALMKKRIGDNEKPLTVEEIRTELSLCFERSRPPKENRFSIKDLGNKNSVCVLRKFSVSKVQFHYFNGFISAAAFYIRRPVRPKYIRP
jgi:hypothetical protein